jgi:hypothetical protein
MTIKIAYDIKKPKFGRKIRSEVHHILSLHINRSVTKKFLIETLLKMTDSASPRFFMPESVLSIIVLIENFFVADDFAENELSPLDAPHSPIQPNCH